ncbi:addiction module protein [Methylomagnum sp.]
MNIAELHKLPNIEKLKVIESLWSDLTANEAEIPAPYWHEAVLKNTEAEYAAGRMEVLDWQEAKKELRKRFE